MFCNKADAFVALTVVDTVPVTLAPLMFVNPAPLPVNIPVLAVNATAVTVPLTPKLVSVPTLVMFGCAAVVTVPAVVAAPLSAPTNVVAVIDALAKLELIDVLITADEFPLALEVVNVGYTVVALDVFCNNADAFVALVALVAAPLNAPTNVVAVIDALAKLEVIEVLNTA